MIRSQRTYHIRPSPHPHSTSRWSQSQLHLPVISSRVAHYRTLLTRVAHSRTLLTASLVGAPLPFVCFDLREKSAHFRAAFPTLLCQPTELLHNQSNGSKRPSEVAHRATFRYDFLAGVAILMYVLPRCCFIGVMAVVLFFVLFVFQTAFILRVPTCGRATPADPVQQATTCLYITMR